MWDVEPGSAAAESGAIVDTTLARTRPRSIVLLHVMHRARQSSLDSIPGTVPGLRADGLRFVTMSDRTSTVLLGAETSSSRRAT